jgi:alpha-tubulin suppressor-like RCC1 family protein
MKDIPSVILIALAMTAFLSPVCIEGHVTLSAFNSHTMQIDEDDDSMWGWGDNGGGQLGQGDDIDHPTPQPVTLAPALNGVPVSVCAGNQFVCVLDSLKNVACAGSDQYGKIGSGIGQANTNVLTPAVGVSDVVHLACAADQVLATTTTGALYGWGFDGYGAFGIGTQNFQVWEPTVGSCSHWVFWFCEK